MSVVLDYKYTRKGEPFVGNAGDEPKFGEMLSKLREARGMNRSELARRLGMNPAYLAQVEYGENYLGKPVSLRDDRIKLAASILEVDPADLLAAAARERGYISLDIAGQPESAQRLYAMLATRMIGEAKAQRMLEILEQAA